MTETALDRLEDLLKRNNRGRLTWHETIAAEPNIHVIDGEDFFAATELDESAALIVEAINALPALIAVARKTAAFVEPYRWGPVTPAGLGPSPVIADPTILATDTPAPEGIHGFEPGQWWRVIDANDQMQMETSSEWEARDEQAKHGGTLQRLWVFEPEPSDEWRDA